METYTVRHAPRVAPRKPSRLATAGLLALCVVPVLAGGIRLVELASSPVVTEANARFVAAPTPVVLHIVGVSVYGMLGALQFATARSGRPWHRLAGRFALPAGWLAAATGVWMTLTYPWPAGDGVALYLMRLAVGAGMLATLGVGTHALVRRRFRDHAHAMIRAYAVGMGAGTQAVVSIPYVIALGQPDEATRAVLMGAGWAINVVVAESVIRRGPVGGAHPSR